MQKNVLKSFSLTLVLFLGLLSSRDVLAETAGFSVDTSVVMLRIEPGKDLQFSFNAKNQTSFPQSVHLEEKDIAIGDENEVILLDAKDGPSSWVTFQENDFILGVGQSQPINASIQVPQGYESGFQMMTMVSFASQEILPEEGAKVEGSIGVYTIISGEEMSSATGSIENFSYPKFIGNLTDVRVKYSNKGDVQFVPQAKISVENLLTRERSEIPFENHFVFPGKNFTFTKSISELSSYSAYEIKISFKDGDGKLIEKSGYALGRFFPIILLFVIGICWFLCKRLIEIRRKNSDVNRGS